MIGKKTYPPIGIDEVIRRVRAIHSKTCEVQKVRYAFMDQIEAVSDVFFLTIQFRLARKHEFIQRRIIQKTIIDRLKAIGLMIGQTAEDLRDPMIPPKHKRQRSKKDRDKR